MVKKINKNKILIFIILLFVLRIIIGYLYYNYDDLIIFNFTWTKMIAECGLFNVYDIPSGTYYVDVDYPPLYIIMLSLIKYPAIYFEQIKLKGLFQLTMKLFPLLFDLGITLFLYKKYSPKLALLWAINIAAIINSAMWGQTDIILSFFIILMFYSIKEKKIKYTGILLALCCLTKLQGIYLVPIYLLYLVVEKTDYIEKIKSLLYGIFTGIIVWLPFMIKGKNVMLPFNIYFGGGTKYNQFNLGAANFWYFLVRQDYTGILKYLNFILLFVCIISLILMYRKTKDILFSSALYLFNIYMITFAQRERYGFYFMITLLLLYIYNKEKTFLYYYIAMFISVAINQIGNLINNNYQLKYYLETNNLVDANVEMFLTNMVFYTTLISLFINIILYLRIHNYYKKKIIKNGGL